jgi:hypothetical protein
MKHNDLKDGKGAKVLKFGKPPLLCMAHAKKKRWPHKYLLNL